MKILPIGSMVVALIGIAAVGFCGGNEEVKQEIIAQQRVTQGMARPATSINKVVIGVLDFERGGGKPFLMDELRRNSRVKLVNIRRSWSLSALKKDDHEEVNTFKHVHQLDMILHTYQVGRWYYFSLVDLYRKKVKEIPVELRGPIELRFRGISGKLLVKQDLDRVLRAKSDALRIKEAAISPEAKERPTEVKEAAVRHEVKELPPEIQGLIQEGPKLIARGQYNRVLELIEDLPAKRRRDVQIRTLQCFANLKGWVSDKDKSCKLSWSALRQKLIKLGDNEATPMLVIFLKDEDVWLRKYAAELLGHIGDRRALDDLAEVGEADENSRVRRYAKWAYEQISGEKFKKRRKR